jgi:hypothetical protein
MQEAEDYGKLQYGQISILKTNSCISHITEPVPSHSTSLIRADIQMKNGKRKKLSVSYPATAATMALRKEGRRFPAQEGSIQIRGIIR